MHDLVSFRIVREKANDLLWDANFKYAFFKVNEFIDPDITINIGKFIPDNKNCFVVDHKYFVKDNYFYCKDSDRNALWEFEVNGLNEGRMTVNWNSRVIGLQEFLHPLLLLHTLLLKPLIELKLLRKKALLLHSACLSQGDKADLLIGRGSSGKSSIAMNLNRNGFGFLGDDLTLFHKKKLLSFPQLFQEYNFRMDCLETEEFNSFTEMIEWFNYLRTHKSYNNAFVKTENNKSLSNTYFFDKSNGNELVFQELSRLKAINRMTLNNWLEQTITPLNVGLNVKGSLEYFMAYSMVFPESVIARHWLYFKECLNESFFPESIHRIILPRKPSKKVIDEVIEFIKGNA